MLATLGKDKHELVDSAFAVRAAKDAKAPSTHPVTISLGLGENAIVFVDGASTGQMLMLHTTGAP